MRKSIFSIMLLMLLALGRITWASENYSLDTAHSNIGFKIRHLGISDVKGKFDKFEGKLVFDGEKLVSLEGTVNVDSVNTAEPKRDAHLKSDDFFSSDKFPAIKFKSTKITQNGDKIAVVGELTIRDVTKVVILNGEGRGFADIEMNGMSVHKTGLVLETEINRKDFGLAFNMFNGAGQAIVADKVFMTIELEGNMQSEKMEHMPEGSH